MHHILPQRAIIYLQDQGEEKNQQRLTKLRQLAQGSGWQIREELIEDKDKNGSVLKFALEKFKKHKFEILLIWELIEIGESQNDLFQVINELNNCQIDLVSYIDQLDTSKNRQLVFSWLKAIAKYNQKIKSQQIKSGLEMAKKKGKSLGRPKLPKKIKEQALSFRREGFSYRAIGAQLGIDESTVRKWAKKEQGKNNINND
jgi:DNA invertase Pin-like site-specific DNA recombinase